MDTILNLTENSCKALVIQTVVSQSLTGLSTASVYTFLGNSEKEPLNDDGTPGAYFTCHAETAERAVPNTRIDWWKVKTNLVLVQPMAESDYATRGLIANNIFDAFLNDSGSVSLTNAYSSSFVCGDRYDEKYSSATVDNEWVQMLELTLLVSPNKA